MNRKSLLAMIVLLSTLCAACTERQSCTTNAFANIALAYTTAGQNDQALQVAKMLHHSAAQADVLSRIAASYQKAGQENQATELFNQALQIAQKIEMPADKVNVLETIAVQYSRAGQQQKAEQTLSLALQVAQTIQENINAKDTLVERIATQYAEIGEYNQGIQVAQTIWEDIPKARALARIAVKYVEAGEFDNARQVANTIENSASQASALTAIATQTGDYEQAFSAAKAIEDEASERKSIVLDKIFRLYIEAGQKQQAANVVSQMLQGTTAMEKTSRQAEELAKVAKLYTQLGQTEQAATLFSQALAKVNQIGENESDEQKVSTLAKVAVNLSDAGQTQQAKSVLQQALTIAQTIAIEDNQTRSLTQVAIAAAKIQLFSQVLPFIHTLHNSHTQVYALLLISDDYTEIGDKNQANQALTQAFQITQTLAPSPEKANKLGQIASQWTQLGKYEQALTVAQTIDPIKNGSPKALALAKIAQAYAQTQQTETAITLLSQALQDARTTQCSD